MNPLTPQEIADRIARHDARVIRYQGTIWVVYAQRIGPYDRRSRPHLFFESDAVVRRVRDYPDDWRALSEEELGRVSERR